MKEKTVSAQGIGLALCWINPWLGLPFLLRRLRSLRVNRFNTSFSIITIFVGLIVAAKTLNFSVLPNVLAMVLWVFALNSNVKIKPSLAFPVLFILFGLITSILLFGGLTDRVGVYGGEPNFSGFIILLLFTISLHRRQYIFISFVILILGTMVTGSRSLAAVSLAMIYFYILRNNRMILLITLLGLGLIYLFAERVIDLLSYFAVFQQSGYSTGFERLLTLNDSSTIERLYLNQQWISAIGENYGNIFLGINNDVHNNLLSSARGLSAHNSFIQKTSEFGIIYVFLLSVFAFRVLPLWVSLTLLTYSLFLHNILSVAWIIALSIYFRYPINIKQ